MEITDAPLVKTFVLKCDPKGEAKVTFRQAGFDAREKRANLVSTYILWNRETGAGTEEGVERKFNPVTAMIVDIWLTMSGADGFTKNGEDFEIFKFRDSGNGYRELDYKTVEGFSNRLKSLIGLPDSFLDELWECCVEVNPQFVGKKSLTSI